jgi:tRNA(Ile)-lysidine synthase
MRAAFDAFVQQHGLAETGRTLLLSVSGGIDSMVMAHLFHAGGYAFEIAHCNFSLRGAESDADEALVRRTAGRYGVPCHVHRFDTHSEARRSGISIQMAARNLRRTWFGELLQDGRLSACATAHHLGDALETVLFNLSKGTGLAGLQGMQPRSGAYVKPLLFATRADIEAYAAAEGIEWREDRSNRSVRYARNLIRHRVVPLLRRINPALEETFRDTIGRLSSAQRLLDTALLRGKLQISSLIGAHHVIDTAILREFPEPLLLLHACIRDFGFSYRQARELMALLGGVSGKVIDSASHRINIDRDRLILSPLEPEPEGEAVAIVRDCAGLQAFGRQWTLEEKEHWDTASVPSPDEARLDLGLLHFPLLLRRWRPGDWFVPLGMQGRKKVSDFLVDRKIPRNLKKDVLVLCSGDDIIWLPGLRIDGRFKAGPGTGRILVIKVHPAEAGAE